MIFSLLISLMFGHLFQLFRDGQAEIGCVLQNGESVVGNGPEDVDGAQDTELVQSIDVKDVGDPNQCWESQENSPLDT